MANQLPVVLTIGGYDPSGGAGITADIETITSLRCHPISLITCLTSQNTEKFDLIEPVNIDVFISQAGLLLSCLLYTSPSPRDATLSRMPSSA